MSQPTPGPWEHRHEKLTDGHHVAGRFPEVWASPRCIAQVFRQKSQDGANAEAEANARLIAAAPEMYEALRDIMNDLFVNWRTHAVGELTEAEQRARALLLKVEA